jgi:hypothetical protein
MIGSFKIVGILIGSEFFLNDMWEKSINLPCVNVKFMVECNLPS